MHTSSEETEVLGLCETCSTLDIDHAFHKKHTTGEVRWLQDTRRYKWRTLSTTAKTCWLCQLMLECITRHPDHDLVKDDRSLQVQLSEHSTGRVNVVEPSAFPSETLEADGWRPYRHPWVRTTGYLRVEASTRNATIAVDILPVGEGEQHNRICHSRSLTAPDDLPERMKEWQSFCNQHHGDQCQPAPMSDLVELRMIDVFTACVVKLDKPQEYFALSYCWGRNQTFVLTLSTIEVLSKPGSMNDSRIPTTISHAISLTKRMGMRYLWVDAFCIVQDDDSSKLVQIQQMNKIYKCATLTIVAAAGDNAWSGLPGVDEPRHVTEFVRDIPGQRVCVRYGQQSFDHALDTTWSRRAWTLQEHLLSRRLLFVTPQQFFWECEQAIFQEGLYSEHTGKLEYHNRFQKWFKPSVSSTIWSTPTMNAFQTYNHIMERVSTTDISFPADLLNSMQGLLNELDAELGPFVWGMPVPVLDSSLLFHADEHKAPHPRREPFPSWSWLGWQRIAVSDVTSPASIGFSFVDNEAERPVGRNAPRDASSVIKAVAYYRLNDEQNGWLELKTSQISDKGSLFYQSSLDMWTDPQALLEEAKQRFTIANLPLSHMLAFWTQSVHLVVDRSTDEDEGDFIDFQATKSHGELSVRDANGDVVCHIDLTDEYRQSQPDRLKFILVAQSWKRLQLCEILHVNTTDGVTTRMVGVHDSLLTLDIWDTLGAKWEFITMA